jgi:hypothetical protein
MTSRARIVERALTPLLDDRLTSVQLQRALLQDIVLIQAPAGCVEGTDRTLTSVIYALSRFLVRDIDIYMDIQECCSDMGVMCQQLDAR